MVGRAVSISSLTINHKWVSDLRSMGITKVGGYIPSGCGDDFISSLISKHEYVLPQSFIYCLVSYLGFGIHPSGLIFRNLDQKDFRIVDFGIRKIMFYVSQKFDESVTAFKYGLPIVMVEGILDAEAFAAMTGYPYVVAYLTSFVNPFTAAFFSTITNKILLVPDQDKAGQDGADKTTGNFKLFGTTVEVFKTSHNDFGDVYKYRDYTDVIRVKSLLRCMLS